MRRTEASGLSVHPQLSITETVVPRPACCLAIFVNDSFCTIAKGLAAACHVPIKSDREPTTFSLKHNLVTVLGSAGQTSGFAFMLADGGCESAAPKNTEVTPPLLTP